MNKLVDKLLQGQKVEWKKLSEVAILYGGLTNKTKSDFDNGNAKFISYKDIFNNIGIKNVDFQKVQVNEKEKQHKVEFADVLFTGSSETINEVGISSVLLLNTNETFYLNSFSFGLRFNKNIKIFAEFSKYLFRSNLIRKQIIKTASGVTRFNISKEKFKKIFIPIPPLSVQNEIVKILDKTTDLTTELTLRKKQYEYYRDFLLSEQELAKVGFEWKKLGEVGNLVIGNGLQKKELVNSGFPAIHYGQIYTKYNLFAESTLSFVCNEKVKKLKIALKNDLLLATISENDTDLIKPLAWLGEKVAVSSDMMIFKHNQNVKFLVYFFQTSFFQKQKSKYITGTKVRRISKNDLLKFKIPVPTLTEQNRIVAILDKFDALTQSISEGLPREIALRQKQYEYYREQLLDFVPDSKNKLK